MGRCSVHVIGLQYKNKKMLYLLYVKCNARSENNNLVTVYRVSCVGPVVTRAGVPHAATCQSPVMTAYLARCPGYNGRSSSRDACGVSEVVFCTRCLMVILLLLLLD